MKRKVIVTSVILFIVALLALGRRYYSDVYTNPVVISERELLETEEAYEQLCEDIKADTAEYDFTVLINPLYGGSSSGAVAGELREADIALSVAKYVNAFNENSDVRIILTRTGNTNPSMEQRLEIFSLVNPDIILDICVSEDTASSVMGASVLYDDTYYDYHLTNDRIADIFEKSIVNKTYTVAKGIFPTGNNEKYSFIYGREKPAAVISCGYITNGKEMAALSGREYRKNIALGILDGIDEVVTTLRNG